METDRGCKIFKYTQLFLFTFLLSDAVFGDPSGTERNHVVLHSITPTQLLDVERKNDSVEKLARGLLQLLFTSQELATGNCTRPMRADIQQLDSERLWAIKCNTHNYISVFVM